MRPLASQPSETNEHDPLRALNLLFDGYWLQSGPVSGTRVVANLLRSWRSEFPGDQLSVALGRRGGAVAGQMAEWEALGIHVIHRRAPQHAVSNIFELGLISGRYDAVICQNFTPMLSRSPVVTLVLDLINEEHPEWFTRPERGYLRLRSLTARRAQRILTISASEECRIRRLHPDWRFVRNTGLALPTEFADAVAVPPDFDLPSNFLLAVGRLNIRKNLYLLTSALLKARIIGPSRPLIIVGSSDGKAERMRTIDAAVTAGAVKLLGHVSDAHLAWLYAACDLFVMPSRDEGFGFPVLEALSRGARLSMSDIPVLREFGNVGTFFDPLDGLSIAQEVQRALNGAPALSYEAISDRYNWSRVVLSVRDEVMSCSDAVSD